MKVSLIVNFDKPKSADTAYSTIEFLHKNGVEVLCDGFTANALKSDRLKVVDNIFLQSDVCIVIGGDGTVIHAAKRAAEYGKPIFGINTGRIGYLTAIGQNETDKLAALISEDYTVENRIMLNIIHKSSNSPECYTAFNDAVISKGSLSRMIDIDLSVDSHILKYRSDGLIAATPSGSTAYSMSAGGPVVDPKVENIIITPICPYDYVTKSIVVPSKSMISVSVDICENKEAFLTIDGEQAFPILKDDKIEISLSDTTAKIITFSINSIYDRISSNNN